MADLGYFSQKIGNTIDRVLCETLEKREFKLPKGRYVSFCFDDFPKSAVELAAPMLESRGWRATWYVAGGLLGQNDPHYGKMFEDSDLERLMRTGHDFGCHTFDHIDCRDVAPEVIEAQCLKNMDFLAARGITDVSSFAYPFGSVNLAAKRVLAPAEMALRGVKPGLNRGTIDLNMLKACGLQENNDGIGRAMSDLDALKRSDGWHIIFTHDIGPTPSPWGATQSDYSQLLQAVEASDIEVVTVGDMVRRLQTPAHALSHAEAA
ncbi:MAG: polysaccharide deacetylase family protein [Pseudomonadota bacterium]